MNSSTRARITAAAAILVVTAALGGCSALGSILGENVTRDSDTQEVTEAGSADVFTLRTGDCFDDTEGTEISDVPAVPCAESHDNEVYHSFEMAAGEWPGDEGIDAAADEQCSAEFDTFVGLAYAESTLDWFPITPLQSGWETVDDREILCAVWDPAGKIEGSLAGVAR